MSELQHLLSLDLGGVLPNGAALSTGVLLGLLVMLGLGIGCLTGLFGVGGAFMLNPLLIVVFGLDETMVVASSLSFTVGTATSGLIRHMRSSNVEFRSMILLGLGAVVGVLIGAQLHVGIKGAMRPAGFNVLVLALYLALLLLTVWTVFRGSSGGEARKSLLQRLPLPPRVDIPAAGLVGVSVPGIFLVGMAIGATNGLLGIGGGVLFMPLLLVVGLSAHQAVGTSLGVVLFSSIVGTTQYALAGHVNLWLVLSLLAGSIFGVQIGAWINDRLHAKKLRRSFALIVLVAAVIVAADLAKKLIVR